MKQKSTALFFLGFVLVAIVAYLLYQFVFGSTLPPTGAATPLPVMTAAPNPAGIGGENAYPSPLQTESVPTGDESASYPAPEASQPPQNPAGESQEQLVFQLLSPESLARFTISEELRGAPKEVIGETKLVSGEILVNQNDLSQSKVGVIQINARDFKTDDERRNSAIRNRILQTDSYEYIFFHPTSIEGLSGSGEVGKTYTFRLNGDLTIREITRPVSFEVRVVAESPTRLSGTAVATIRRSDFNLIVPNVPFVANVADEVKLELIFVAVIKST